MKLKYKMAVNFKLIVTTLALMSVFKVSKAQYTGIGSVHYQNQYLLNPAMAGQEAGILANLLYSKQLIDLPGAPTTKIITLTYKNADKKVGLGLNLMSDKIGIINRTRIMGTYAYHLPINLRSKLRLGLSLGLMKERVSTANINGTANDMSLTRFNERPAFIDGDFGLSYEYSGLQAQVIIPNLRTFLNADKTKASNVVDHIVTAFALSYKFELTQITDVAFTPRVMFNKNKGFDNILDVGVNTSLKEDKFSLMLMYHSTKNISVGLGAKIFNSVNMNAIYRTSPAVLKANSTGYMEVGLGANLSKL